MSFFNRVVERKSQKNRLGDEDFFGVIGFTGSGPGNFHGISAGFDRTQRVGLYARRIRLDIQFAVLRFIVGAIEPGLAFGDRSFHVFRKLKPDALFIL